MNRLFNAFENRFLRGLRTGAGLFLVLTLLAVAGCSTDGAEEEADAEYPNINEVPETPETAVALSEAEDIGEGLRADRENARYTDETLRADTSVQPPPAQPAKPASAEITETVTETVTETAEEKVTTVTEEVTEKVEEKAPEVAAVAQTPVTEQPLPAPEVTETKDTTPPPAPVTETIITGESAKGPEVESVFQQQLAASGATRLPESSSTQGTESSGTASSVASNSSSGTQGQSSGGITLTPPTTDGGRAVRNYAASDGSSPIETIYFAQGSHRINAADRQVLDRIARAQLAAGGTLKVVGHASKRTRQMGEAEHMIVNLNVSQARATAVAEYLLKAGVAPGDMIVESVSDAEPLIDEPMPSAEAKNRRTEIFLLN
ncbi:OmpA family protein [uncultured Sneathiella sp.]|jgi:outer membrane protein OmpA-like peptidoglycan-associated protein|uniref:OmpA family protein n=1 Tax=uncultured Sneathiella sp. TaxID=879315 RepID=UPI0030DB9ABC|tara:strand:+ start:2510 stop:3640 length:1131 start_codon:yes stop_codon:yes gene_type:complete